jgi:hypothetical protein
MKPVSGPAQQANPAEQAVPAHSPQPQSTLASTPDLRDALAEAYETIAMVEHALAPIARGDDEESRYKAFFAACANGNTDNVMPSLLPVST